MAQQEALGREREAQAFELKKFGASFDVMSGRSEPSVTARLAECRQLIAAATTYREASGSEEMAQRITEIKRRLQAANFDERSPAGPPPTEEDT